MKKKLSVILLTVVLIFAAATMTACGVRKDKIFGDFTFTNPEVKETVYDLDEGVKLDGVNDDPIWQGEHSWYVGQFSDGTKGNNEVMKGHLTPCELRVTSAMTDKGLYFFAEMDDEVINVWRETPLSNHQKTGLTFYIAAPELVNIWDGTGAYEIILGVDGQGNFQRYYKGQYRAYPMDGAGWATSFVNGNFDEHGNGTADGYKMEVFLPWKTLKLDKKPEFLNVAFAGQRHENASLSSQFTWEWNATGSWNDAYSWLKFVDNGFYTAHAEDKTIDGNGDDWADYKGQVKRVNFTDGVRYVEYKMQRGEDGLYVYTEALQKLYITENGWWQNTSIEVVLTNKNGEYVSYPLDGAGYKTSCTEGIMKAADKTVEGKTYKFITAEYFIPNILLKCGQIDIDADELVGGLAFLNGSGAMLEDGTLDPEKNEITQTENPEVPLGTWATNKPYLLSPYGASAWARNVRVTEDGITTGVKTNDKIIDGKDDDWSDYHGVNAVATGRNEGDDKTSVGKGFTAKAVKGSDGVYVYATVKHAVWEDTKNDKWDNSNLAVKFSVSDTAYTNGAGTDKGKAGEEIYFSSIGCGYGAANQALYGAMFMERSADQDEDGLYTTVIEAFVPYRQMGLSDFKDDNDNLIFDPETGKVADGYVLRIGFRWRNPSETAYMQGYNSSCEWFTAQFPIAQVQNHFIVDENGLHQSRLVPTSMYVDGKTDDWTGVAGDALKINGAKTDDVRYAESKAVMKEEGLFVVTTAKVKNFVAWNKETFSGNNVSGEDYKKNSSLEIRYIDGSGANAVFGVITPSGASLVTSWIPEVDYVYNVAKEGDYYVVTIEAFFNKNYLKAKTGSENPNDLKLSFAYYVHDEDDGTREIFAPAGYDTVTAVAENALYYVTALGMTTDEDKSGKIAIYESHVTDNIKNGVLGANDTLEVEVKVGDKTLTEGTDYTLTLNITEEGGSYTVEGMGDYLGKIVRTFNSGIVSMNDVQIIVDETVEYLGKVQVTLMYDGEVVSPDYYTLQIEETNTLGQKTVTVTGKDILGGTKTADFEVVPKDISDGLNASVNTILINTQPSAVVTYGDVTLVEGTDYTVVYDDCTTAGNKTATVTGKGNYTGTLETNFVVLAQKRNLGDAGAHATATGYAYYEPEADNFLPETLTVTYDNGTTVLTLHKDVDFTLGEVAYDNTDGGTATLTINGAGLFEGSMTVDYTINLYRYFTNEEMLTVEIDANNLVYSGEAHTPDVTVQWNGTELTADTDYTIAYSDNVNAGTATVTVTAKAGGAYKSAAEKTFTINPKSIEGATVTVTDRNLKHTGRAVTPNASVTLDGVELEKDTEFTLSYAGDTQNLVADKTKNYGEATVKAVGKGNYTGETAAVTYTFESEATEKRIDGDASDWADYNGNTSVFYAKNENGKNYEIKAKWESDGIYVFAVVHHATLKTDGGISNFENDSRLHILIAVGKGGTDYQSGGEHYVTNSGNFNRWRGSGNAVQFHDGDASAFVTTGEAGAYTTMVEAFIPNRRFAYDNTYFTDGVINSDAHVRIAFNWCTDGETVDIGWSEWANQTAWQPLNRWTNAIGSNYSNVRYFYYLDNNDAEINRGLRYEEKAAEHYAIDANDNDWATYDGNIQVVYNDLNTKGYEVKAKWESDGVYVFATVRHATFKVQSGNPDNDSRLQILIAFQNGSSVVDVAGIPVGALGNFNIWYTDYAHKYPGVESAFKSTKIDGGYVTKVETFIPNAALMLKDLSAYFDGDVMKPEANARIAFNWKTQGESEYVIGQYWSSSGYAAQEKWLPMKRWTDGFGSSNSNVAGNFYYLDKNSAEVNRGLRYSKYAAKERGIDGNLADWADYDEAAKENKVDLKTTEGSDGRYIKYRAYYGTDGVYLSVEALINKVVIGNRPSAEYKKDLWQIYVYNTSWQMTLGGKTLGMAYGWNQRYDDTQLDLVESAMAYKQQANGKYLVGMEMFVPKSAYTELGLTLNGAGNPELGKWIFGCNNTSTAYLATDYESFTLTDGTTAASTEGNSWFGGNYTKDNFNVAVYDPSQPAA